MHTNSNYLMCIVFLCHEEMYSATLQEKCNFNRLNTQPFLIFVIHQDVKTESPCFTVPVSHCETSLKCICITFTLTNVIAEN